MQTNINSVSYSEPLILRYQRRLGGTHFGTIIHVDRFQTDDYHKTNQYKIKARLLP